MRQQIQGAVQRNASCASRNCHSLSVSNFQSSSPMVSCNVYSRLSICPCHENDGGSSLLSVSMASPWASLGKLANNPCAPLRPKSRCSMVGEGGVPDSDTLRTIPIPSIHPVTLLINRGTHQLQLILAWSIFFFGASFRFRAVFRDHV
jgi:hypothetical protein